MSKKKVEPGHRVATDGKAPGESATAPDGMQGDGPYLPGMAPLAADGGSGSESAAGAAPDAPGQENADTGAGDSGRGDAPGQAPGPGMCMVTLRKGATYTHRSRRYEKGAPTAVTPDVAARLMASGMFAKG